MTTEAATRRLTRTAYHEAGHAVMGFLVGRRFRLVTIEPGEDSLGHVMFEKFSKGFQPGHNSGLRTRAQIENGVMAALAGPTAEHLYSGRRNNRGASDDHHYAVDLATYEVSEDKELEAYIRWLSVRTRNRLTVPANWSAVKAVANELLVCRRMSGKRTREVVQNAMLRGARKRL